MFSVHRLQASRTEPKRRRTGEGRKRPVISKQRYKPRGNRPFSAGTALRSPHSHRLAQTQNIHGIRKSGINGTREIVICRGSKLNSLWLLNIRIIHGRYRATESTKGKAPGLAPAGMGKSRP